MSEEVQQNWIANFWRRIGALFIDTLILGLVGFLLGLTLESTFVQIGGWGRLIGFVIALVYFGAMNSKLFNGQTIGKKVKKAYGLTNINDREDNPSCTLIQSHQKFE